MAADELAADVVKVEAADEAATAAAAAAAASLKGWPKEKGTPLTKKDIKFKEIILQINVDS